MPGASLTVEDSVLLVQLTDSHLFAEADGKLLGMNTCDSLEQVVELAIDEQPRIDLILATGGTGPSPRDQTPEAMADVIRFDLPGFGESMRAANGKVVATAILSRQGAGVRGRTLIITLPGSPNAISTSLEAVFAAVPYCLDLIGAARIETDPSVIKAHRPKGA